MVVRIGKGRLAHRPEGGSVIPLFRQPRPAGDVFHEGNLHALGELARIGERKPITDDLRQEHARKMQVLEEAKTGLDERIKRLGGTQEETNADARAKRISALCMALYLHAEVVQLAPHVMQEDDLRLYANFTVAVAGVIDILNTNKIFEKNYPHEEVVAAIEAYLRPCAEKFGFAQLSAKETELKYGTEIIEKLADHNPDTPAA